jgi:membrane protein
VSIREPWLLLRQSVEAWYDDNAPSMGAALAYYATFSLAPLLIIVVAIVGVIVGRDVIRGRIVLELAGLVGKEGARTVEALLSTSGQPSSNVMASALGLATLLLGATSVFAEMQSALDRIWRAPVIARPSGFGALLRARLLTFGMVVAMGFLLLVSLVFDAALSAFGAWGGGYIPGRVLIFRLINLAVGFGVTTLLCATAYRILPRARIAWSDVWIGAVTTAALFSLGKYLIGMYLGRADVTSGFGAAGSLVIILVWMYYSAQIFLLGAEFTWVFAHRHGSRAGEQPELSQADRRTPSAA